MSDERSIGPLVLALVQAPGGVAAPAGGFRVDTGATAVIGRSVEADLLLADETVSRRHALIERRAGQWFIIDLGSRSGTVLNGVRLEPMSPAALATGDVLGVGRSVLRVGGAFSTGSSISGTREILRTVAEPTGTRVRDVAGGGGLASKQLAVLLSGARRAAEARNEDELAHAIVEAAIEGTGFTRAALVQPTEDAETTEIIAFRTTGAMTLAETRLSRTLIRRAMEGHAAQLSARHTPNMIESIAESGVEAALCVPVTTDAGVEALLYLDARDAVATSTDAAADLCSALSTLYALALANLRRRSLIARQQRLESQLNAAREVQRLILPPDHGRIAGLEYALTMRPGQIVAGDLFDAVALPDGRTAALIGDVTGEGAGAAILMAGAQAGLHTALLDTGDPAESVNRVNRYLAAHSPMNRFVSLWVGVFDPVRREVEFVDAGHGHWIISGAKQPEAPPRAEGIPAGIDADFHYESRRLALSADRRIVLYSDGVVEQRGADAEQFGADRLRAALCGSPSVRQDCDRLAAALADFMGPAPTTDDTTVASLGWAEVT